ncbi:D-alanyl-D-alanine carboxypeptidase family protein [Nostocales cyanobacterium LEGE 11386]|nr:D-alanyl-D-alanine carboxypeptidase family protein [Nostocales cyanobacterium LEGE 11386]MBW4554769.1 D-alanyl-D-alanine carboxypeptidase family protein [Trichormus sp. ATA11-4-KO1]
MNKAGFSGQSPNLSGASSEDIPVALRDIPDATPKLPLRTLFLLVGGVGGFILLVLITGFLFFVTAPKNTVDSSSASPSSTTAPNTESSNSVNIPENNSNALLGHLTYPEAPESELVAITADGRMRMRKAAAQRYQAMAQAARSAGVILVPISGFRSVKEQEQLFFGISARRNQTPAERAAVSAPPGHSEHHTGYAVDIGDGAVPATNLQTNFENTKAYKWLEANAARFGFELSFPKDNPQGVSYEPWHWRFVGDRHSLELFYKAKNLPPSSTSQSTP